MAACRAPVAETLRSTPVSDNTARATGRSATAQGGGVFDISIPNGPPGGVLTLINSNVSHNTLSGSTNAKLQGGAVFTTFKLTLTNSALTANTPDECAGTGCYVGRGDPGWTGSPPHPGRAPISDYHRGELR